MQKVKIPKYSLSEELINAISHGIGAGLSIAALVLLIVHSKNVISILSSITYGVSLIVLYTISCIYHSLSPKLTGKKVLRVIDHCNVLLLEAGTYTPICTCLIKGKLGLSLLIIIWVISIIAIVANAIDVDKYQGLSVVCHLAMGWGILLFYPLLKTLCPTVGLIYLILGGVMYTIGAILYGLGAKKKYMHSIFHFFVLAGSIFHFFMIYLYVI